ncbi:MAG: hypothetical protein VW931_00310 [Alphaproteobacteria bacterium]
MPADAEILARLRGRIAAIERDGSGIRAQDCAGSLPLGIPEIDSHLPWGGLVTGAVHEFLGENIRKTEQSIEKQLRDKTHIKYEVGVSGAVTAFAAALAGKAQKARAAPVIWIAPRLTERESLYGPGLLEYGLDPAELIVVRIPTGAEFTTTALWALEEALRAPSVGLVCAEIEDMDLTASRRLQLAAEAGGGLGLLLRTSPRISVQNALPPTASVTRWRVSSLPGSPAEDVWTPERLPGHPRWRAELLRARGGRPHAWNFEWRDDRTDDAQSGAKTGGFALVSPLRDRPVPQTVAPSFTTIRETRRIRNA